MEMIRYPYMKKAFADASQFDGKQHFGTFRKEQAGYAIEFVSDRLL